MNYEVPFYANTADDTHCYQAAIKSVLKYFLPEKDFSWQELDKITDKSGGLWTWQMAGLIWLKQNGFDVNYIETLDYEKFVEQGGDYLINEYGKSVGSEMVKHSDIPKEQAAAKEFVKNISIEKRPADFEDIKNFLKEGYLLIVNVNSRMMNNKPGYAGHFIVITGIEDDRITFHDPGLPAFENRKVTLTEFNKAWAFPDEKAKNLMAIKKL